MDSFNSYTESLRPFEPPRAFRHPWVQTIGPQFWPTIRRPIARESYYKVHLADGDALHVTLNKPQSSLAGKTKARRIVVIVHGLGGDQDSQHVRRLTHALLMRGHWVLRMNMRGCGPGRGFAQHPYHSGRSDDLAQVIDFIENNFPQLEIDIVGYSLGGNLVLKYAAEISGRGSIPVRRIFSVSPPIDLAASATKLGQKHARLFDRFFLELLKQHVHTLHRTFPDLGPPPRWPKQMSLRDFDDLYTAPRCGFECAQDYYAKASSGPYLHTIDRPTHIIWSKDDPIVDVDVIPSFQKSAFVQLHPTDFGGHVGFYDPTQRGAKRWWLDQQLVEWIDLPYL